MQTLERIARYLLALALAVFGADKFLHFMPPPEPPPEGGAFLGALVEAGWVFPIIGGVFMAAAVCLITRRVLLGLVLVAPITVNILAYHIRYDMSAIAPGAVLAGLQLFLYMTHPREVAALFRASAADPKS